MRVFTRSVTCFLWGWLTWKACWPWAETNGNLIFDLVFSILAHNPSVTLMSVCVITPLPGSSEVWACLCSPLYRSPLLLDGRLVQPSGRYFRGAPHLIEFSGSSFGPSVMSLPALIPVAFTSLQRRRPKKQREQERESWSVVTRQLANNMAAAIEDD